MAGKQIKQEIVLSGEKQYNAAIKEAQRNLKTLQSALKAETAELGRNATEQQKNEVRAKSLKEQIKEQERIVQTLREALAAAREEYGDNEAEVAKWEQRLNNARATLANMRNDLEDVGATKSAIKSVADALESIGSAGESVSSAIENIFSGMIDTVTDAVGELWSLISETAAKANNWTDIAGYWGTDAQTIQEYARATAANGKNFEDLQSIVSKIVMGGKGKTIAELLGISDVKYESDWGYAMAVMDKLNLMQKKGKDMTPIYEQIFGERRSVKVMDLVNGWDAIQELRPQFNGNESGYGMSDQELATMDELWVKINTIEQKWQALKDNFAAGFGQVSLDLLVNVEGTLDGIADYLNAKDEAGRQAALEKIRKNVEEFFTKLGEIIQECIGILREVGGELQGSDDPLTRTIGDILVALADSLQWLVDNADAVKTAFDTIFGVWLLARLAAVAGRLSAILVQIEAIKAFKGIGITGGADGAGGGGGVGFLASGGLGGLATIAGLAGLGYLGASELGKWKLENPEKVLGTAENRATRIGGNGDALMEYVLAQAAMEKLDYTASADTVMAAQERIDRAWARLEEAQGGMDALRAYNDWRSVNNIGLADWQLTPEMMAAAGENRTEAEDAGGTAESYAERLQEAISAGFGDAEQRILDRLDESGWQGKGMEDLPWDWVTTLSGGSGAATAASENGITSSDLQRFNGLPAGMLSAVKAGAREGVSGIRVSLDGRTVGQLVAPYVSESIARDIVQ